jgi:hypothetical protein
MISHDFVEDPDDLLSVTYTTGVINNLSGIGVNTTSIFFEEHAINKDLDYALPRELELRADRDSPVGP